MSRASQLLRPRAVLPNILDITPEFMERHNLRGLLLDLDNTLIPYGSYEERAEVSAWARGLQSAGYLLYLLSNATRERARIWAERLELPGVGLAGKPFAREYRRGLSAVGLPAEQVAMVGDQLFTDVLGGNWSGMFTIMVRPISDNALPHTRLTRKLERLVLKRYGHDWPGKLSPPGPQISPGLQLSSGTGLSQPQPSTPISDTDNTEPETAPETGRHK